MERAAVDAEEVPELPAGLVDGAVVVEYKGERKAVREGDERYCGVGSATFFDGSKYTGCFAAGQFHGHGKFEWGDGSVVEGEFRHNKVHGEARMTWANGSTYHGEFSNNLREGHGVLEISKLGVKYDGNWKASLRNGLGKLTHGEDVWYDGEWKDGKKHGRGEMMFASGDSYSGEWANDAPHGCGTMTWTTKRERYIGQWKNGRQHGAGQHVWFEPDTQAARRGNILIRRRRKGGFSEDRMESPDESLFEMEDKVYGSLEVELNVRDLIPDMGPRVRRVLREVENVLLRWNASLRGTYMSCCRLHEPSDVTDHEQLPQDADSQIFTMQTWQFWVLCRVCSVTDADLTLAKVNRILLDIRASHGKTTESDLVGIHGRYHPILFREFVEAVVRLSFFKYAAEFPDDPLASLVARFMSTNFAVFEMALQDELERAAAFFAVPPGEVKRAFHTACGRSKPQITLQLADCAVTARDLLELLKSASLAGDVAGRVVEPRFEAPSEIKMRMEAEQTQLAETNEDAEGGEEIETKDGLSGDTEAQVEEEEDQHEASTTEVIQFTTQDTLESVRRFLLEVQPSFQQPLDARVVLKQELTMCEFYSVVQHLVDIACAPRLKELVEEDDKEAYRTHVKHFLLEVLS